MWVFSQLCLSDHVIVRIIAGYVSAALFLPLVATGMHHGLVALYSVQLQELGYVTLYPALAMAGAGQVGAAAALWMKAKRVGNKKLCSVIAGALPAGCLGIGEPLIYGVTLPLGRPFITAGLGAGFGGALVMAFEVASTTWGPSGLLGVFVMTDGPCGAVNSALIYLAGLAISCVCSFIITSLSYNERELRPDYGGESIVAEAPAATDTYAQEAYQTVRHGDAISLGGTQASFTYVITDPTGLHARPAGSLAEIVRKYHCRMTASANGKSCSASSPIELLSLGASQGTELQVSAEGADAHAACRAVKAFLEQNL